MEAPLVGILMGSDSDWPVVRAAAELLREWDIPCEVKVLSAHRTPQKVRDYAVSAAGRGLKVVIAAAGGAAHLAGVVASFTLLPVIGVPIKTSALGGMDSLLSIVQMPAGVPVATVGIGEAGAVNAAVLAARILATERPAIEAQLQEHKRRMDEEAQKKAERIKTAIRG